MQENKTGLWEAVILAALLLAYSNGIALWALHKGRFQDTLFGRLNPVVVALLLLYAGRRRGGLKAIGLKGNRLGRSLLGGAVLGGALSVLPLIFFHRSMLLDRPLEYGPVVGLTRRELLTEVLVRLPVGVAGLEEVAFRGLLYDALRREMPAPTAMAISSAAFAGWHITVTATTTAQTNLAGSARLPDFLKPHLQPLAVLGGMLSTGLAGATFAFLRERTGNLAGAMLAHWLVDSIMIVSLWRENAEY